MSNMSKINLKMTKNRLFTISSITLILGFLLIGCGLGHLFQKHCIVSIIGAGVGLVLFAVNAFRTLKRMDIYNKTEI